MAITAVANDQAESIYASLAARSDGAELSVINEAENRFLTLLTTQLKNQDPLNPMENAELTSQLAQISTVNGIEKLNATLQTLLSGMTETQAMQAASLVDRTVLVPGNTLEAGGESIATGGVELAAAADSVRVNIKNANGQVVRTLDLGDLGAGVRVFDWDGLADDGAQVAAGTYHIDIEAERGGDSVTATALETTTVNSVIREGQTLSVDLANGTQAGIADIRRIF